MSIKTLKARVEDLLEKYNYLRDDDTSLIQVIWNQDLRRNNMKVEDARFDMFAHYLFHGVISNPQSITRARRVAQEMNVNLRGKRWSERHQIQEPAVQEEIRDIKNAY